METNNLLSKHNDRFLNITKSEWVRVLPVFCVKLFFQIALVAGGTILTALFISEFSVESLPLLFMAQALLVVAGTTIVSGFLRKYSPSTLIIATSFFAAVSFFGSSLFFAETPFLLFPTLIIALSIFLAQISIWLSLFIENLFSPLEGERVIPLIESSEPIGGILSGLVIVGFVEDINVINMLIAVGGVLFIIPFLLMFSVRKLESIPVLKVRRENSLQRRSKQNMFVNAVRFFRQNHFITGLFFVIFCSFFILQLLEFQYTLAVDEHVRHSEKYVHGEQSENSTDYADALTHNFGEIQIFIFGILFVIQLLFASRILQALGVMRTFALAPILSFLSFAGMFFHFSFFSVIFAKGVFEVSSGIGRNAFIASFYALHEDIREEAKEVLEGIGRPLGLFFGTVGILILENSVPIQKFPSAISVTLCVASAFAIFTLLHLQKQYTLVSKKKLDSRVNLPEKMNAIEILSQKGHQYSTQYLLEALQKKDEVPEVQIKILKVIGFLEDENAIPAIIKCFHDQNTRIPLAAVEALGNYKHLGKEFFSQSFSVYSMQSALKELFLSSKSTAIKVAAIKVFANLRDPEIIPFLIHVLQTDDPKLMAESVSVCGMFHDSGTIRHLEPFLKHENARVRSATIIALWQFVDLRIKLIEVMAGMLGSDDETELINGIYTTGETKSTQERERLLSLLKHQNQRIRRHAAIALGKMNEKSATEHILEFLFHEEKKIGIKTKRMIKGLHKNIRTIVERRSMQEVIARVSKILKKSKTFVLENLENNDLYDLLHLFHLINAEREMWKIQMILNERGEVEPAYT